MRLVFAAILLLLPGLCHADSACAEQAPAWGMPQLMQSMAGVKSSRKKFTERKFMSVLTTPLESSGTLSYRAPAWLEKHTLHPRDEKMVLDHGIIYIANRAGQVQRSMMVDQYPAIGAFVESIRATLAGDQKALDKYYRAMLAGNASRWHLQLTPKDPATLEVVREIRMKGRGNLIDTIEILEANGDRSVMTVTAD
jgi:Outer membrane lipoprotein carrier protein LolA-like